MLPAKEGSTGIALGMIVARSCETMFSRNLVPVWVYPKLPLGHGEWECSKRFERPVSGSRAERLNDREWADFVEKSCLQ